MELEIISASNMRDYTKGIKGTHRSYQYLPTGNVPPLEILSRSELIRSISPIVERETIRKSSHRAPLMDTRKVWFIDGEGSNFGDPELRLSESGLRKSLQQQNYSLLTGVFEDGAVRRIIGKDNVGQLSTRECLEFLLSLPPDDVLISFGFTYDVEMILRDVPKHIWEILHRKKHCYYGDYVLMYIPHKLFYIRRRDRKKKKGGPTARRIFDIAGFFGNVGFKTVTEKWKVATPEEQTFLERMKKARPDFGPITQEVLDYNELEGHLGIRVFKKIRSEWIGLGLKVQSPHGAGALASAMYIQNELERFQQLQQRVDPSPFKRGYIGGRFDYTRQGEFPLVHESDINSAYPHIMRNLLCLTHTRVEWRDNYAPELQGLWLVRYRPTNQRWALFPYRSGKHIRYHENGIGYYYADEVRAALQLDSTLEIQGGYVFIPECDEKPFDWIETYYNRRQELKATQPFTAEVLKIGMNSGYGKLAQTKGHIPRHQNLIWAGMITSGTRAMLLNAIAQSPESVICVSTDSVTSTIPLQLRIHETELGAWKQKRLEDYLLLGNGFAHSTSGKDTHRGFLDDEWKWSEAREEWRTTGKITAWKMRFNTSHDSFVQKDSSIRCSWSKFQSELGFELPKGREIGYDGWIWPSTNPTPYELSAELSVPQANLRMSQFGVGDFLLDLEAEQKLIEFV